ALMMRIAKEYGTAQKPAPACKRSIHWSSLCRITTHRSLSPALHTRFRAPVTVYHAALKPCPASIGSADLGRQIGAKDLFRRGRPVRLLIRWSQVRSLHGPPTYEALVSTFSLSVYLAAVIAHQCRCLGATLG